MADPNVHRSRLPDNALADAARGWAVLPLHSVRDGRCTCGSPGCARPAKHPFGRLVPRGVKDATTDPVTIRSWWAEFPDANVGIATGGVSGLIVLDKDPRHGGDESLAAIEREHGQLPATVESGTGGGGGHFLFAYSGPPIRNRVNLARGIDLRADGGYIVAPPSVHASGQEYAWIIAPDAAPLAEIPNWLRQLLQNGRAGGEGPLRGRWAAELPPDWDERLARDPILSGHWDTARALRGTDQSLSAYALAIANRVTREYHDSDEQILGILDAFYRHHGRTKSFEALVLTLRKARGAAPGCGMNGRETKDGGGPEPREEDHAAGFENGGDDGAGWTVGDQPPTQSLAELLGAVETVLRRYVVFASDAQVVAIVLWVAHCHVLGAFEITPYLHVSSPERRSGKSHVLDLTQYLTPRAWRVGEVTPAVLFRKIAQQTPTVLLDEADGIFAGPKSRTPEAASLRSVLNMGFERGAVVPRCARHGEKLEDFPVFCAKALAGIGTLPDTVSDRCIHIVLRRKKDSEAVEKLRKHRYATNAAPLREALVAWGEQAVEQLRGAEPKEVDLGNDRAEDVWEPLFAVADLAGTGWPDRARQAAIELTCGETDTTSVGVMLLRAIFEVFEERKVERILTAHLLDALIERETEPWAEWWGPGGNRWERIGPAAKLAGLLRPFGITPKTLRAGEDRGKGYERAQFEDAFDRYLPRREKT